MDAKKQLTPNEYQSVKKSFFEIYLLFVSQESIPRRYVDCIVKWGAQLNVSDSEMISIIKTRDNFQFVVPEREKAFEQMYDLVYMIYLDNVVEEVELEVAMKYAEKLGFEPHVVGDLLKAIVAAPADGIDHLQLRDEIKRLLLV
jgi:hypothetical protein